MFERKGKWLLCLLFALVLSQGWALAQAQTVKITPLGQRTGELCAADRALLFEDPTGVRVLYDPGFTIAGGTDRRLGAVDVILVSHNHGDHIGVRKLNQDPDDPKATCGSSLPSTFTMNTNTAEIAAAKNSAVLVGPTMPLFLSRKIETIRRTPTPTCPGEGLDNEMTVPRASPCTVALPFGARRTVTRSAGAAGVRIAAVHAQHSDAVQNTIIPDPISTYVREAGLPVYGGLAIGYFLAFTNGLKAYLSGDTGHTSDMHAANHQAGLLRLFRAYDPFDLLRCARLNAVGTVADQQFVKQHAQRIDVAGRRDRAAA